ncbi:MAG: hypothetical protein LBD93_07755 [Treponema sp.]|jgi:hypothetical protein|nr:hypothetical protein [Treponema sp.]
MCNDFIPASESEFLAFATTFNAGATTHAGKLDQEDRKEQRESLTKNIRTIKNVSIDRDQLDAVQKVW